MAWWFDQFEKDASAITLAVARLAQAVLEEESRVAPDQRLMSWREIRV